MLKERFARFLGSLGMTTWTGLLMLGVGITSLTLAVTSIGVGFGIQNSRAADIVSSNNSQALFRVNGNHNVALARQLLDLAACTAKSSNFDSTTPVQGGAKFASARAIAEANTGASTNWAPKVKLFESSVVASETARSLSNMSYRLYALTWGPDVGGVTPDPVFTFVASTSYMNRRWGFSGSETYEESRIRQQVCNDFDDMIAGFGDNLSTGTIVAPQNLPGNWQENQADLHAGVTYNNSLSTNCLGDKIWIPSAVEVVKYFGVYPEEYLPSNAGGASNTWLRSSAGNTNVSIVRDVSVNGSFLVSGGSASNICCYVAGLHISGAALRAMLPVVEPGDGGDDNGGDDGDGNGGSDGVDPTEPVGPNNPIVPDYKEQSQKGLSAGALGGIIGGSVVAGGAIMCVTVYLLERRRIV